MIIHGSFRRIHGIEFGIDIARNAAGVCSPVIKNLRNMHNILGKRRKTKNHIMVLATVKRRTEKLRLRKQFAFEQAEMTDVIICAKRIQCIVRLKMQGDHIVDRVALKGCLITIDIIRILFVNCLAILVERRRMQNIIMVEQSDIISRCHSKARIGVTGNSFVSLKFLISYPFIVGCVFCTDFSDICMLLIGSVRKTQFPVFVSLGTHGIDHVT